LAISKVASPFGLSVPICCASLPTLWPCLLPHANDRSSTTAICQRPFATSRLAGLQRLSPQRRP